MISDKIKERFFKYVTKGNNCWLWNGCKDSHGYGVFGIRSKYFGSHRISYKIHNGDIPKGLMVLHKCDIRNCVNPDHLYIGDTNQNMKDMKNRKRHPFARKTHCKNGHEFTEENTRIRTRKEGGRECKECSKIRARETYYRNKK